MIFVIWKSAEPLFEVKADTPQAAIASEAAVDHAVRHGEGLELRALDNGALVATTWALDLGDGPVIGWHIASSDAPDVSVSSITAIDEIEESL